MIALKIDKKFEGELACSSKNCHEEFGKFSPEHFKVSKLMASFCLKFKMYELKIYRGVMCHDNEQWGKIWRGSDLSVEEFTWGIWQILTRALENLKHLHFNRLLLTKVNNVWAKKIIEELFFRELNIDAKFEGQMTCVMTMKNDTKFEEGLSLVSL